MRRFTPLQPSTLPSLDDPNAQSWIIERFYRIQHYLEDSQAGFQRIVQGQVPNGSGDTIGGNGALTNYFFLPGRIANQVGHGGTAPQGYLALSSTTDAVKGKVYFGESLAQAAFDESTGYLGIGTVSPSVLLHISQTAALTYARPNGESAPTWRDESGGSTNIYTHMNEATADDSNFIQQQTGGQTYTFTCPDTTATNYTVITLNFRARKNTATVNSLFITLSRSGNTVLSAKNVGALVQGPGFTAGSYTFSAAELLDFNTGATNVSISVSFDFGGAAPDTCAVSWFEIAFSTSSVGEMSRWTQSDGTVLLGVDASGDIFGGLAGASTNILANNAANSTTARIQVTSTPDIIFDIPTGTVDPLTLSLGLVSGTLTGRSLTLSLLGVGSNSSTMSVDNSIGSAAAVLYKAIRNASQSANLFTFFDSNGSTVLSAVDKDGIWTGPISSSSSSFIDSGFRIIGSSDATKKLAFEVDGFTAATTRTVTPQNLDGTMALLESAQTFTKAQAITPTTDVVPLTITGFGGTADMLSLFDPLSGFTALSVTTSDPATALPNLNTITWRMWPLGVNSGFNISFQNSSTPITADRVINWPDATGLVLLRTGTPINTTGRTTSVATSNLLTSPVTGAYQISAYMHCSTVGDPLDNVILKLLFDDGSGVKTINVMTLDLSAVGNYAYQTFMFYHTAGTNIRYSTTLDGSHGANNPAHSIRIRLIALG